VDHGIEVTDRLDDVSAMGAELGVVVAYGRLVPGRVLDALPMVNVHFSLLPRWRGAAPVERAVLADDSETGVCIMALEESLDTGPVLASRRVSIGAREHVSGLTARLATIGAELLVDTLAAGVDVLPAGVAQEGEPTYAEKLRPEELHLDWSRSASELERVVRLDRAWTTFRHDRLRVLDAVVRSGPPPGEEDGDAPATPGSLRESAVRTGDGVLELLEVQPAGKRPMSASAWCRGVRVQVGETLGDDEQRR
jgi:methionyl-tRNA formyltransferase